MPFIFGSNPGALNLMAKSLTDVTVVNNAAIADLLRITLPTNLQAGDQLVVQGWGHYTNNTGIDQNPTFTAGLGSTNFANNMSAALTTATAPRTFNLELDINVVATAVQEMFGSLYIGAANGPTTWSRLTSIGAMLFKLADMTEDLSSAKDIFLRITHGAADPNLSCVLKGYRIFRL